MQKIEDIALEGIAANFQQIRFRLKEDKLKPILTSQKCEDNKQFDCMLDSGAAMPVWCTGIDELQRVFPKAVKKPNLRNILSGFGEGFVLADVCYVPTIKLCNGEDSLTLGHVYLPVVDRKTFGADLILPSAIFKESNILISQVTKENKALHIQSLSTHYRLHFTKRELSEEQIKTLRRKYDIPDEMCIYLAGAEDEFSEVLLQEDAQSKDSEILKPLDAFSEL